MRKKRWVVSFIILGLLLIGCSDSGENGEYSRSEVFEPIADSGDAEELIDWVNSKVDNLVTSLNGSTFDNLVIPGDSGEAVVINGYKQSSTSDCGLDCIKTTYITYATIQFSNYEVDNVKISSGTIVYDKYSSSTQTGSGYSSTTSIEIYSEQAVTASAETWSYEGTTHGIRDIISYYSSGSSISGMTGTCTTGSGDSFSF